MSVRLFLGEDEVALLRCLFPAYRDRPPEPTVRTWPTRVALFRCPDCGGGKRLATSTRCVRCAAKVRGIVSAEKHRRLTS